MSYRLCVIGNSHTGALVLGWNRIASEYPDVELTFFASPGRYMEDLAVDNGILRPSSDTLREKITWVSGGKQEIDPAEYDSFCLMGFGFGIQPVLAVYKDYWAEHHRADKERTPVSDLLFSHLVNKALDNTQCLEIHRRVREVTDKPIHIFVQPNPSGIIRKTLNDSRAASFALAHENDDNENLGTTFSSQVNRLIEDRKLNVLRQPRETIDSSIFTQERFGRESVKLQEGFDTTHRGDDYQHMNPEYGEMVLRLHLPTVLGQSA